MLATMTPHSHSLTSMTISPSGSLTSNTAGSALPLLPRRSSASRVYVRPNASGIISPPRVTPSPVKIMVQQATPPEDDRAAASTSGNVSDSASSSSSSSSSNERLSPVRVRGNRGYRKNLPTDPTSPTLAIPRSKKDRAPSQPEKLKEQTERKSSTSDFGIGAPLKLSLEGLPKTLVEFPSIEQSIHKSAPVAPVIVVRKKSGQLVKPSLKTSKSTFKSSLNVTPGGFTKSEPATPTVPKAVKFDSRLEHVKLFLAEQRPLAVSRDGSPTDDTSGTESDFPFFIFGDRKNKILKMVVTNLPLSLNENTDLVLEEMKLGLDEVSIVGRIRVRNLSFQKWVAVRFTFDDWQTTSEVTAKHIESPNSEFDVFGFLIRLSDLIARIEEKTLVLAIRYNVNGREIWDNNFGRNYVAKFSKEMPNKSVDSPMVTPSASDKDIISSGSDISDLHSRLEKVVKKMDADNAAISTSLYSRPTSIPSDFKTDTPLASRYDFGVSLKNSRKSTSDVPSREHTRMHSYPIIASHSLDTASWPRKHRSLPKEKPVLGSPRDLGDSFRPAPFVPSDSEEGPEHTNRHHQRGYFDMSPLSSSSSVKMTPPGTPRLRSLDDTTPLASPRFNSLPSMRPVSPFHSPHFGFALSPKHVAIAEAMDGVSSLISPPLSNSTTPTDSPPFVTSPLDSAPGTNYNQFLDRYVQSFHNGRHS